MKAGAVTRECWESPIPIILCIPSIPSESPANPVRPIGREPALGTEDKLGMLATGLKQGRIVTF